MKRVLTLVLLMGYAALPARAETLVEALADAYRSNPDLLAQRSRLQVVDETYVQARTGLRPTVSAQVSAGYTQTPNPTVAHGLGSISYNSGSAALTLTQPIYTGGRTTWQTREAKASVLAGREQLRGLEAQVFQNAISAYVDVLRDQDILEIRRADLATLQRQADEAQAKFDLGQSTKTDLAQAQAQLEGARSDLASAEADLAISRAGYQAVIGHAPGDLKAPDELPGLPPSIDQAFDYAEAANPSLNQSRRTEEASRASIAVARSAYRPTVALEGGLGYVGPISPLDLRDYDRNLSASVVLTQPILTGGLRASQVRQAVDQNNADRIAIESTRRQVVQATSQAWHLLLAGRAKTKASEAQVAAAEEALRGAQAEYSYGLRTTLEVLIADQNLRAAQVNRAESRHDAYVAAASVLNVTGRLEAGALLPGEPLYDPKVPFDKVRNAGATPYEGAVETLDKVGAPADTPPAPH